MRLLIIAPNSNLKATDEIIAAVTDSTVTLCTGEVDRAKAEQFLRQQYDAVHLIGHGGFSVLQWSDGLIEASELVDLLRGQQRLRFVVIMACLSARVGAEIHNALHVPVVMCQAEITDPGAGRFSEVFYRSLRTGNDVHRAVASGRAALAQVSASDGDVVTLINGDMATDAELSDCMTFVRHEIGGMRTQLAGIEATVNSLKRQQPRWFWPVVIGLLALLVLAQLANPYLTALATMAR